MFLNRLSATGINESKYYSSKTFNHAYGGANWLPNCTAYAVSRVYEALECDAPIKLFSSRDPGAFPDAKEFYKEWLLGKGQEPRLGSVLCWGRPTDKYGHVAFVERVSKTANGWRCLVSQSNFGGSFFETKEYEVIPGKVTKGVGYVYMGACYTPIHDSRANRDVDRDQIEIFGELVRVRKTPNGEALKGLYCPLGLFNVLETNSAGGYKWAQLENDKWVAYREDWAHFYKRQDDPRIEEYEEEIKVLMGENNRLTDLLNDATTRLNKIKEIIK